MPPRSTKPWQHELKLTGLRRTRGGSPALKRIDLYVIRWARRKFKRLRRKTKGARDWFDRLRRADAKLSEHASDHVDYLRALLDQQVAGAMHRQRRLLLRRLLRVTFCRTHPQQK